MVLSLERKIGLGGLAALGAAVFVQTCRLDDARAAIREEGLALANAEARADSSRDVSERLKRILGDSIRAVERLAIQADMRADAVDRVLGRVTQANVMLTATVRELAARQVVGSPTTETSEGVRQASFDVRQEPFTVHTRVSLPRPPGPGVLDTLSVRLDSIRAALRLQCDVQGTGPSGIKRATALLTGPPWANLALGSVQQGPEVCNQLEHRTPWFSVGLFAGGGYGLQLSADSSQVTHGWQLTAGVGVVTPLWPRKR